MRLNEFTRSLNLVAALFESSGKLNTHMLHAEQLLFSQGYAGLERIIQYFKNVTEQLEGKKNPGTDITVKWDGSPAIVCGIDPADGQFFVGMKGVFNKVPKIMKTMEDIEAMLPDKNESSYETLRVKMRVALKYLPELNIKGIVQGDLMFTNDAGMNDLFEVPLENEQLIAFRPNTLAYGVPKGSTAATTIQRAKLGIIFHTRYVGNNFADMAAQFGVNKNEFTDTPNVWFDDAFYKDVSGVTSMNTQEVAEIEKEFDKLRALASTVSQQQWDNVIANKDVASTLEIFVNTKIKAESGVEASFMKDYIEWYAARFDKDIDKVIQGQIAKGKEADYTTKPVLDRQEKKAAQLAFIQENLGILKAMMQVYAEVQRIKTIFVRKLSQIEGLKTFYKDKDGMYKVTPHEGFVSVDHENGVVKLNDRLTFNYLNFVLDKNW